MEDKYSNETNGLERSEEEVNILPTENNHDQNNDQYQHEQVDDEDNDPSLKESDEPDSRFKDGEELMMVRVRFPGNAKSFPFLVGKRKFQYGQKVMAMSDRGMTVGYINSFPYKVTFNKTMLPLRSIAREATAEDIRQQIEFHESEKKAEVICLRLIEKYELDMVLTHVEFIQFGKKAVFYFNAPQRVDFRDLVKDLVQDLKMRIELRQISVRDRAAALGSIGACGLQTCCSSFLKNYGNVSIKMAKNQNLALIPSKLNGVCGQIKCCIKYEDEVYNDKRKNLPKEGSIIQAQNGDIGKVLRLHLLIEQFEMLTDFGVKRKYASNQFTKESLELPVDYRFPETFDNITDETKTVIGLTVEEELVSKRFKELMDNDELEDELGDELDGEGDDLIDGDQDGDDDSEIEDDESHDGDDSTEDSSNQKSPAQNSGPRPNQAPRPQQNNNQNQQRRHDHNRRPDNRPDNRDNRNQRPRPPRPDNRGPDNRGNENRPNENRPNQRPHHHRGNNRPQGNAQGGQAGAAQAQGSENNGERSNQHQPRPNRPHHHNNNQNRPNNNQNRNQPNNKKPQQ